LDQIKVVSFLEKNIISFFVLKRVKALLKFVPPQDLIGINKIELINKFENKTYTNSGGIYSPGKNNDAKIILAIGTIYNGMPTFLHLIPFIPSFLLAMVLYHEIGHHYKNKLMHSTGIKGSEYHAEQYSDKILREKYKFFLLAIKPIYPFIMWLRK